MKGCQRKQSPSKREKENTFFEMFLFFYIFLYGFYISFSNISSSSLISASKKVQWWQRRDERRRRKQRRAGVEWSRRFVGLHKILGHLMEGECKPIWAIYRKENYTTLTSQRVERGRRGAGSGKQVNKSLNTQNRPCKQWVQGHREQVSTRRSKG